MSTKILVSGVGGQASYNFIDALKLSRYYDYEFVGVDSNNYMLPLSGIKNSFTVPKPGQEYLNQINFLIDSYKINFMHPQPDPEVVYLCAANDLVGAKTFLPDLKTVLNCQDKLKTNQILKEEEIPVPEIFSNKYITPKLSSEDWSFSIRDKKYWLRARTGAGSKAALPISSYEQAQGWLSYWEERGLDTDAFILSEFLPGKEYAWQSIWYEGELVVSQGRERVEYLNGNLMPSGQSSSPSVARTVSDDRVNEVGFNAVNAISDEPHGVFGVDMKENEEGTPCVTEINAGRFYTTSNFFAHAGLNMPDIYMQLGLYGESDYRGKHFNPLPENLYWIRGIDRKPKLVHGDDYGF